MCFLHFDLEMCFAPQRRALFRHLNFQKWSETVGFWQVWLGNVLRATTACTFFDISTSKSGLRPWVFWQVWLGKCASRHKRRALFSTSQLPKVVWDRGFFDKFDLENVLRATTARTFSTSQLPKSGLRPWVFDTFWRGNVLRATNGAHFFHLSSGQMGSRTRRFSEVTFSTLRSHKSLEKQWNLHLVSFWLSPSLIFSLLDFSSLTLATSAFSISAILSEVWLFTYNYLYTYIVYHRRKFRSQTSDNMQRWKKQRWQESERRSQEVRR